jgi:hypothetical protein
MHDDTSPALRVALAYYRAWTTKDVELALTYLADDIVCDAPAGRIEGLDAYRAFIGPFAHMLIGATMIAAFGDAEQALIMYDTRTTLVESGPGAECLTVRAGKITYSRFIFDRTPFAAARSARTTTSPASDPDGPH